MCINMFHQYMHMRRQIAPVMLEDCKTDSCVRGYHVYQDYWLPIIGEQLE